MFFPDIAEYEDSDSELAKYTICLLHSEIYELRDGISKAIEYIKNIPDDEFVESEHFTELLEILKGEKMRSKEEKDKEIERLNNIINELEKWAKEELEHPNWASCGARCMLDKLQELKGVNKE